MKRKTFKYIFILVAVSVAGVLLIQYIFLRDSYKYTEKQFRESASVALREVVWQLQTATGSTVNFDSITPVEAATGSCYIVNVDAEFDREALKTLLSKELKKHDIYLDYEFSVFDPVARQMEEGILITGDMEEKNSGFKFPISEKYINYFTINFPDRSAYFNSSLSVWYLLTALLIMVISFFGYTLFVIIRQRQLSEIQKSFINNLTHELKTPISSIALSTNIISDKGILKTPQRLFEYIRIIKEQNDRLSKNVENVLNLVSLEKNRIQLDLEEINLKNFLSESVDHFRQSDLGQKAEIQIDINNSTQTVMADKFHFQNLVVNILENGVKYCENEPLIVIKLAEIDRIKELSFTDNGIGIAKEHRKRIFKRFYRIPTGNVHNVKGFGLGLDYVDKIVKAHRWKIRVTDNSPGGSIFTITIPDKK